MRILKITAWIIGGLIALLAVSLTLVVLFFNPNNYKSDIEELVTKKTGRDFKLTGDLKLSVFPWLAVQVGPTTLGNAPRLWRHADGSDQRRASRRASVATAA